MRSILGLIIGGFVGFIACMINYADLFRMSSRGMGGFLIKYQLDSAMNLYMFGGAIIGLLIVLINQPKKN